MLGRAEANPYASDTLDLWASWQAHVDAGRIGVPAPRPPAPPGRDYGLVSLEAIMAGARWIRRV